MGQVDVNERWTKWEELVENLLIKNNCPPYHFTKDEKRCNRSYCRKCIQKYILENRKEFS